MNYAINGSRVGKLLLGIGQADTLTLRLRDTLQRHAAVHGQVQATAHPTLPRALHACANCVRSKQRCSGSHPCDRCNRKQLACRFPPAAKEVRSQTEAISPNTTGRQTSHQSNQTLGHHGSFGLSPIRAIHPSPGALNIGDFAGGPSADIPSLTQPQQTSQSADVTSLFDSFLFWPLDGVLENTGMASEYPSLRTPPNLAENGNQPTSMLPGSDPPQLPISQHDHPGHAEQAIPQYAC